MIELLVEFIGTFIFLAVIIVTGNPLAIAIALASAIYFGGKVSGGHFNPAVNVMMYLHNKIDTSQLIGQTVAQLLGAVAAFFYFRTIKAEKYI
tara:strand:+ start:53 stop:331 length:279 start_codon:yes stop_codon:yes gene_type:complete